LDYPKKFLLCHWSNLTKKISQKPTKNKKVTIFLYQRHFSPMKIDLLSPSMILIRLLRYLQEFILFTMNRTMSMMRWYSNIDTKTFVNPPSPSVHMVDKINLFLSYLMSSLSLFFFILSSLYCNLQWLLNMNYTCEKFNGIKNWMYHNKWD